MGGMKKKAQHPQHVDVLPRLRRIAGQVQGIERMVTHQAYCIDIMTQIQAVRGALRAVELRILEKHLAHCVTAAFKAKSTTAADCKMTELLRVMKKQF